MREKKTRQSKGYGFVLFRDEDAAVASVRAMNTVAVGNNRLQVRLAHPSASKDLQKQCRLIPQCQSLQLSSLRDAHPSSSSTSTSNTACATQQAPCAVLQSFPAAVSEHHHGHGQSQPLTGPIYRAPQPPTQPHAHTHAHAHTHLPQVAMSTLTPVGQNQAANMYGNPSVMMHQVPHGAHHPATGGFMMPVVMVLPSNGDEPHPMYGGFAAAGFPPQAGGCGNESGGAFAAQQSQLPSGVMGLHAHAAPQQHNIAMMPTGGMMQPFGRGGWCC